MARLFGLIASVGRSFHFDEFVMLSRGVLCHEPGVVGQGDRLTSSTGPLYKYGSLFGQETTMFERYRAPSRATRDTTTSCKTGTPMPARRGG